MYRFAIRTRGTPGKGQRDITEKKIHGKKTSENLQCRTIREFCLAAEG